MVFNALGITSLSKSGNTIYAWKSHKRHRRSVKVKKTFQIKIVNFVRKPNFQD